MSEPLENVTVIPDETNTQKWTVEIRGPVRFLSARKVGRNGADIKAGSPYVGGRFVMSVDFALDYPFRAPQVCPLSKARRPGYE